MLKGDTNPWRDLGHARFYDPLAPLEDPKSAVFREAVEEETTRWKAAVKPHGDAVSAWSTSFEKLTEAALPKTPDCAHETSHWNGLTVKLQHGLAHRKNVWFLDDETETIVREHTGLKDMGLDAASNLYYTIEDVGTGSEYLEIAVYSLDVKKPLWKHAPVGSDAAFREDRLLYGTIENVCRTTGVVSVEKHTGKGKHTLFDEPDARFQVTILAPPNQEDVFVHIANALAQRIGVLTDEGVHWLTATPPKDADGRGSTLVPVTRDVYATNTALHVKSRSYVFPNGEFLVDAIQTKLRKSVLVVTVAMGVSNLYEFDLHSKVYTSRYKSTSPNEILLHSQSRDDTFRLVQPNQPTILYELQRFRTHPLVKQCTFPEPVALSVFHHGFATSKDGTRVPYTFVSKTKHPKRLFVDGYGAYGSSARRSYPIHWLSWLDRGYALVTAMPRGGRDNGDAWYDGGRTAMRKHHTFEDTAAVIATVQRRFRIQPRNTAFYGRSAGGWLAATIAQQYSHLVGVIYTEVPYVDVLRTSSNPKLPLTKLEYDEFGHPAERPYEYKALQRLSPIDTVPLAPEGAPTIVVRTALYDVQVLPYEAIKWAKKLRAAHWNVYLGIDQAGGHFAAESDAIQQQAEDAVLIEAAFKKPSSARTTTRRCHACGSGSTPRRTSSRKQRTRQATSTSAA